jgi:hypothetical protein
MGFAGLAGLSAVGAALFTPIIVVSEPGAEITKLRFGDRVTLNANPETSDPVRRLDVFTTLVLVAVSSLALTTRLLLAPRLQSTTGRSFGSFLTACSLGAGFLAADELLGIHENLGANIGWLGELPVLLPAAAAFRSGVTATS